MADNEPERLQWRRRCVQSVITPNIEFSSDQPGSVVNVNGITFVDVNPPDSNDFPASGQLMGSGHLVVHAQLLKVLHLHCPGLMHQLRNQVLIADIVPCHLITVAVGQSAHLCLHQCHPHLRSNSEVVVTTFELMPRVDPMLWVDAGRSSKSMRLVDGHNPGGYRLQATELTHE